MWAVAFVVQHGSLSALCSAIFILVLVTIFRLEIMCVGTQETNCFPRVFSTAWTFFDGKSLFSKTFVKSRNMLLI